MHGIYADSLVRLTPCGAEYSFFFDLVLRLCPKGNEPLHRICCLMRRMDVASLLEEELPDFPELTEEAEAVSIRCDGKAVARARRFTFFRILPSDRNWESITDADVLGYVVLVTLTLPDGSKINHILEAVVRVPTKWIATGSQSPGQTAPKFPHRAANHYIHCCRQFSTTIGTANRHKDFALTGTFFAQQNGLTHVCAHAALRMALNSWTGYSRLHAKITNSRINEILGLTHKEGSRVGKYGKDGQEYGGLSVANIMRVVEAHGFQCVPGFFDDDAELHYADFVYPAMESGFPVILGIGHEDTAHVLSVFGHTMNCDRWEPLTGPAYPEQLSAEYVPSRGWADHFIGSDDNLGMHVALPTEALRKHVIPSLRASMALVVMPSGTSVTGPMAEAAAVKSAGTILSKATSRSRWFEILQNRRLVCRTVFQERRAYLDHLMRSTDADGNRFPFTWKRELEKTLPARFWLTEFTVSHLMAGNKRKLADVLTKVDATLDDLDSHSANVFGWFPGLMCLPNSKLRRIYQTSAFSSHIDVARAPGASYSDLDW